MLLATWKGGTDSWVWLGDSTRLFSVRSVKNLLVYSRDNSTNSVVKWCKWVPNTCNINIWRAELDKLPTQVALSRRNIQVPFRLCGLCDSEIEAVEHVLVGCSVALKVWDFVSSWCKFPPIFAFSVKDLLDLYSSSGLGVDKKVVFQGIVIIACWSIWKARNDRIFEGRVVKVEDIVGNIRSLDFLWYKY
ncbi:uncharacterized protein LOC143588649 [Bidens hawaiensis]|uniref:uncharacterized protein LOC143588649 n=1 Tax=Bidens hawaiensis TaxID=980011 RepID=UPI00404B7EAC